MGLLKKIYILSLLFLLFLWLGLAFLRLFFNAARSLTTEREWLLMTNNEKRIRLLGREHIILSSMQRIIPESSKVLVYLPSHDVLPGIFYKTVYYLYPRKLVFVSTVMEVNSKTADYVISYTIQKDAFISNTNFKKIYEYKYGKSLTQLYKYE